MLRNPDRMTTEERDAEVAHLLGKALLRIHHDNKKKAKRWESAGSRHEGIPERQQGFDRCQSYLISGKYKRCVLAIASASSVPISAWSAQSGQHCTVSITFRGRHRLGLCQLGTLRLKSLLKSHQRGLENDPSHYDTKIYFG